MTKTTRTTETVDPERSRVMRAVKSKNTKPELVVRRALWKAGLRYRLHDARIPGKPDIVLMSRRTAVFVHGCFWHGHEGCPSHRIPKTRREYWEAKISRNKKRDETNQTALEQMGWDVIVIWECQIRSAERLAALAKAIGNKRARRTKRTA